MSGGWLGVAESLAAESAVGGAFRFGAGFVFGRVILMV